MKMKKRILSAFLSVLMTAAGVPLAFSVPAAAESTMYAQYGTPTIDGKIDSIWGKTSKFAMQWACADKVGDIGSRPLRGSYAMVMWDKKNLYFLAVANDPTPSNPKNYLSKLSKDIKEYTFEYVDFWVSETADDMGNYFAGTSANYTLEVSRFEKGSKKTGGISTGGKDSEEDTLQKKEDPYKKTATVASVDKGSYYVVEVAVPWTETGHQPGDLVGFNCSINDDMNKDGPREYYVSYANPDRNVYYRTCDLPTVELAGTVPGGVGKATAKPTAKPAPGVVSSNGAAAETVTTDTQATDDSTVSDESSCDETAVADSVAAVTDISSGDSAAAIVKKAKSGLSGGMTALIVILIVLVVVGGVTAVILTKKKKSGPILKNGPSSDSRPKS